MHKSSFAVPLISIGIILSLGMSTIWSTVPSLAISQAIALGLGAIAAILISRLDSRWLHELRWPLYWLAIALLLFTEILGISTRGSTRWIDLGFFNFQTSEFVKPMLIVSFAGFLSDKSRINSLFDLFRQVVLMIIPVVIIFLQPDLGSAISLFIIWFGILLFSEIPKKYIVTLVALGVLFAPIALSFLRPYQLQRIESFMNPFIDPKGAGYNVIQSTIAVGSGQLLGKGVRQGTQSHLRFLPERHTDFAYASFSEEFGFIGVTIMLISFLVLFNWLINQAKGANAFGRLITLGFLWWIFGQMSINIGMNMGMLPVTGITLPFVSYGGSSLLAVFFGLGIVFAFSKDVSRKIEF